MKSVLCCKTKSLPLLLEDFALLDDLSFDFELELEIVLELDCACELEELTFLLLEDSS